MKYIETEILTNEIKESNKIYIIITGDSSYDLRILKEIGKKYNGIDKILFNPTLKIQNKKGKTALNSLSILAYKYRINSIIFIIDGEYFNDAIEIELKNALLERAYNIKEILYLNHAYSIKCQKGDYEILLYCIISGIEICIEEEIVKFIKTKFSIEVNISEIESKQGKDRIKREINQILKRNNLKDITELIKISEKRNLEEAFPNICAVFKKIEEDI